ncbi:hypothetical protein [Streptomyces sp. NPDC047097]|uniref:hypothetical protein n=1 Tax=Streptomyces sp. NPDC047097 TaxID=3155260 RepID=UPI0033F79E9D
MTETSPAGTRTADVALAGQSVLGVVWTLAGRLGVVARTPAELVAALAADPRRRTLTLSGADAAREPLAVCELVEWLAELGTVRLRVTARPGSPAHTRLAAVRRGTLELVPEPPATPETAGGPRRPDAAPGHPSRPGCAGGHAFRLGRLDDPSAVCAADPLAVTAAYAADEDDHGGLRPAWLRAGQALCAEPDPARRALVLLAALSDAADPRLRPALAAQAATAPWRVVWNRVQGDIRPPWPGPVGALATAAGRLLAADPAGRLHAVHPEDGTPAGRPWDTGRRIRALAPLADGRVLRLDDRGRLATGHLDGLSGIDRPSGVDGPSGADRPFGADGPSGSDRPSGADRPFGADHSDPLTDAVAAVLTAHPGSALTAAAGTLVVGDRVGSLHAFEATGLHQTAAHRGRVTAASALAAPGGRSGVTVYSGGADGTVRAWRPGRGATATPLLRRDCPVAAVHAARTGTGTALAAAWTDGLVRLHRPGGAGPLDFRPGPPVRAVAVTGAGTLVIGMDEALLCLAPAA